MADVLKDRDTALAPGTAPQSELVPEVAQVASPDAPAANDPRKPTRAEMRQLGIEANRRAWEAGDQTAMNPLTMRWNLFVADASDAVAGALSPIGETWKKAREGEYGLEVEAVTQFAGRTGMAVRHFQAGAAHTGSFLARATTLATRAPSQWSAQAKAHPEEGIFARIARLSDNQVSAVLDQAAETLAPAGSSADEPQMVRLAYGAAEFSGGFAVPMGLGSKALQMPGKAGQWIVSRIPHSVKNSAFVQASDDLMRQAGSWMRAAPQNLQSAHGAQVGVGGVTRITQTGGRMSTKPIETRIISEMPGPLRPAQVRPQTVDTFTQQTLLSRAASLTPNGRIAALEQRALEDGAKLISRSGPQRTLGNMWGLLGRRVTTNLEIPAGMRMPGLSRMGGNVGRTRVVVKPGEIGWRTASASGPKVGKGGAQTLSLVRHERTALGHAVRAATLPLRLTYNSYMSLSALPGRVAAFFAKAPVRLATKPFRMAALHTTRPLMRTKLFQNVHGVVTAPIKAFNWGMRQLGRGVTTTGRLTQAVVKKGVKKGIKMYFEHLMNQMRDNPQAAVGTLIGTLVGLWGVTKAFGVGAFLFLAAGFTIFGARAYFGIGNAGDGMAWVDRQVDRILGRHSGEHADGQEPAAPQTQASEPEADAVEGAEPEVAEDAQAEEDPEAPEGLEQAAANTGSHRRRWRRHAYPVSPDATGGSGLDGSSEIVARRRSARDHQTGERRNRDASLPDMGIA